MTLPRPELPAPTPALSVRRRPGGFTADVTACAATLSVLRNLVEPQLTWYGVSQDVAFTAELLLSELVGNADRACTAAGVPVRLLVEVSVDGGIVTVAVHDPVADRKPAPSGAAMDCLAEHGRGLELMDALADGWTVKSSPFGKQIVCRLAAR
jgi:anti-sigma regulatory factor (Ser/Thr protein kinase)